MMLIDPYFLLAKCAVDTKDKRMSGAPSSFPQRLSLEVGSTMMMILISLE